MSDTMKTILSQNIYKHPQEVQRTVVFTKKDKDKNIVFFGAPAELLTALTEASKQTPTLPGKPYWLNIAQDSFLVIHLESDAIAEMAAEEFYRAIKYQGLKDFSICLYDVDAEWLSKFHLRVAIQSYAFTKYMLPTHLESIKSFTLNTLIINTNTNFDPTENTHLASSILWARDLANEPSNVCTPEWLANEVSNTLAPLGVETEVLDEQAITALGMSALMGVAKGSSNSPKVVIMKYLHGEKESAPVVLLGKGVTFDSGGISLKPSHNMGDMKDDMAGAATVSASIRALALNKAKVNVIGVIGLVENMPDGNAQKPGDIVTTLSGQTIEIINTDAEGRLVLVDLMWYAQDKFKPKCMVDYATLTGAIVVALGRKYAGLFSNNDNLSSELLAAGIASDDQLWRMPMCSEYDRSIDSKVADIDNSGPREASSSTAAHFIGRFTNGVPWAHLDIAGTAFARSPSGKSPVIGGTGFGVHLTYNWLTTPLLCKTYL